MSKSNHTTDPSFHSRTGLTAADADPDFWPIVADDSDRWPLTFLTAAGADAVGIAVALDEMAESERLVPLAGRILASWLEQLHGHGQDDTVDIAAAFLRNPYLTSESAAGGASMLHLQLFDGGPNAHDALGVPWAYFQAVVALQPREGFGAGWSRWHAVASLLEEMQAVLGADLDLEAMVQDLATASTVYWNLLPVLAKAEGGAA